MTKNHVRLWLEEGFASLTVCLCVGVDITEEDASFNWLLLFCFFWYLTIWKEHTFEAPGVGLEPTSPRGHQLSYFLCDLEADPF